MDRTVLDRYNRIHQDELALLYESRRGNPAALDAITDGIMEAIRRSDEEGYTGTKLQPEDVSLRRIWEATVGPVEKTLMRSQTRRGFIRPLMEAVDETSFPKITGELIAKVVVKAYQGASLVADQLVTNMPSKLRIEQIAGFQANDTLEDVPAGTDYQYSGIQEKWFGSEAVKRGRLIALTEEMIMFDQTGQVIMRARKIGERGGQDKEKEVIGALYDVAPYAGYFPAGVAAALWVEGANLLIANALVDYTDLENARLLLARMVDERGEPIVVYGRGLLVPEALRTTAEVIAKNLQTRVGSGAGTTPQSLVAGCPVAVEKILVSPYLDWMYTTHDTTIPGPCWFYGDFKEQLYYHEVLPVQVLSRSGDSDNKWNRDIPVEFKVRRFGNVAVVDNKHIIKSCAYVAE